VELQPRDGQAVVEAGGELDGDLDLAGLAADQPQQLVVAAGLGGVPGGRTAADGQAVDHGDDAAGGGKAGLKDVGGGQVAAAEGGGLGGGDAEMPAVGPVEQAGEHRPGVEAVKAAPVDRGVPGDQGGRMASLSRA
jgi:hypothetical protein